MEINIEEIQLSEENILRNMFEFYDYDFSQYLNFDLNEEGVFRKAPVSKYLLEEEYNCFFVKSNYKFIGFVIVKVTGNKPSYEMEQFFIMKKYNGKGIGKRAANQVFDRFRGEWKVTQVEKNYTAQAFWRSVIKNYTNHIFKESYDENRRSVQEFSNGL